MSGAVVIMGPTASGKTGLAMQIARQMDVEIISADSAQVYRGMDIGTAKPGRGLLTETPHHLIDIRNPEDPYSAASFRDDVVELVPEIQARGRLPLIIGGAMLYLKALKDGLAEMPAADPAIRDEINRKAAEHGWESVHRTLAEVDPVAAARINPTDTQRLQRALEVYRLTGSTLTELHRRAVSPCPFPLTEIALVPGRAQLHEAIAGRFMAMLDKGFVDEVAALRNNPRLHSGSPSLKAVGYRQVWSYLAGDINYQAMTDQAIAATRQLAKRQFTWLRSWQGLTTLESPAPSQVLKILAGDTIL